MKKSVEDKIKKAVESWENQKSDIGFDKDLVWQSIKMESTRTRLVIGWNKIAVILILLLITSGWGYSFIMNKKLQQDKIALLGNIQTLGTEIQIMKQNETIKVMTKAKTDTVVKVIHLDNNDGELVNKLDHLQQQNLKLNNELQEIQLRLKRKNIEYKILSDSMEILAMRTNQISNQDNKSAKDLDGNVLRVNEEQLLALSNDQKKKNQKQIPNQKSRIKLVIFNKQDKPVSKAPEKQGFRL